MTIVSQAKYDASDRTLELLMGDTSGKCETYRLSGPDAEAAKSMLDALTK